MYITREILGIDREKPMSVKCWTMGVRFEWGGRDFTLKDLNGILKDGIVYNGRHFRVKEIEVGS